MFDCHLLQRTKERENKAWFSVPRMSHVASRTVRAPGQGKWRLGLTQRARIDPAALEAPRSSLARAGRGSGDSGGGESCGFGRKFNSSLNFRGGGDSCDPLIVGRRQIKKLGSSCGLKKGGEVPTHPLRHLRHRDGRLLAVHVLRTGACLPRSLCLGGHHLIAGRTGWKGEEGEATSRPAVGSCPSS